MDDNTKTVPIDLLVRQLKNKLISEINESILPIEIKSLILTNITQQIQIQADMTVNQQLQELNKDISKDDK